MKPIIRIGGIHHHHMPARHREVELGPVDVDPERMGVVRTETDRLEPDRCEDRARRPCPTNAAPTHGIRFGITSLKITPAVPTPLARAISTYDRSRIVGPASG